MCKSFTVASGATGAAVCLETSAASSALTAAIFFSNQTGLPAPEGHHQHGKYGYRFPVSEKAQVDPLWGQC